MWYVLQVKTGDEIKVRDALLAKGVRALVPQESRMIRKDGKWGATQAVAMDAMDAMRELLGGGPLTVGVEGDYASMNFLDRLKTKMAPSLLRSPPRQRSYSWDRGLVRRHRSRTLH